ncbi:transcriptional regulator [Streptomyces nigra]|uniref:transcriptional regulator n=1 Tax=Streptomyces nigra TaxID=1827580 RepID=UPI00382E81D6
MTVVAGTPPPRLPVRDRQAALREARGVVSPMLTRLADERATGVLHREHGTLHLVQGRVVHAESPLAPSLGTLLTAHGDLDTTAWRDAEDSADEAHLLRHGLTPGVLELAQVSALYDAAYFALAPSSTPGRFRYGGAHWLAAVHPVPVDDLERETVRRRALLRRIWPDPAIDGAPLVRADPVAAPAVPSRQAAVLARVDGVRKAVDIARELGRPAFHTLVHLRRLAAAGLVATRTPPHQDHPSDAAGDPYVALLKRVRDALEAL